MTTIEQTLKDKINEWIIMLDSPDFHLTDAELVRDEMIEELKKAVKEHE